ncbi:MAG: hypothetical protein HZA03_06990 [Nitrospinae bacterium]|nr:hypothetical protein [Nitrospinota bacterium]
MGSKPIVGRAVFYSALMFFLAVAVFVAGCVPPKNKTPKSDAVTSAPEAAAPAAVPVPSVAATAPVAAPTPPPATAPDVTASPLWQNMERLEREAGKFGLITVTAIQMEKSGQRSSAPNTERYEISMDVTGRIRKPSADAVMNLDAFPALIAGVEATDLREGKRGEIFVSTFLSGKGRAGWRMQSPDGSVSFVSQKLRLYVDVPGTQDVVNLRLQRAFKKGNGDLLNKIDDLAENVKQAKKLLENIDQEAALGQGGSAAPWAGVSDCAAVKGEAKNGVCYPTDESWRIIRERTAALTAYRWSETVTLRFAGGAGERKEDAPSAKTQPAVEAPKPVEAAKPAEAPKPVEAAKPAEAPKPVEAVKPVEAPKPVEAAKPAEAPKPVEAVKPVEAPKPVEAAKPAEAPKPVKAPTAQQEPAKKPIPKKGEVKPKDGESGKPLYDLSDVLGK